MNRYHPIRLSLLDVYDLLLPNNFDLLDTPLPSPSLQAFSCPGGFENTGIKMHSHKMLAGRATSTSALGAASSRTLPSATVASRYTPSKSQPRNRTFATVQEGTPKRTHGGLRDEDRIFQNLYGHHGADLKSAMKYGDWYRTKDIILKGHEWVRSSLFGHKVRD